MMICESFGLSNVGMGDENFHCSGFGPPIRKCRHIASQLLLTFKKNDIYDKKHQYFGKACKDKDNC